MSWSRGSLLAALLALPASIALADTVVVDTTADDTNAATCSLRDAVAYLNIPADERPASHSNGCGREGDASTTNLIKLPYRSAAYVIDAAKGGIDVDVSLSITGEASEDDDSRSPFIWVKASRALKIDGPPLTASLGSVDAFLGLDADSDTGVSDSDRHTSVKRPTFSGAGAPASSLVCLYVKSDGDEDYALAGEGVSDAAGDWEASLSSALDAGVHEVGLVSGGTLCEAEPASLDHVIKISVYDVSTVSVTGVDFVGCGASTATLPGYMSSAGVVPGTCSGVDGGIFHVNEGLSLENVVVRGGAADRGGIAYVGDEGVLGVTASSFLQGSASEGSAIYVARGGLIFLSRVLVAESAGGGEAIRFAAGVAGADQDVSAIENTTIHGGDGYALTLQDFFKLNAVTIIDNASGSIRFAVSDLSDDDSLSDIYNSIISGQCTPVTWPATSTQMPRFNVADSSCSLPASRNVSNNSSLLAVVEPDDSCASDATGVLCARDEDDDGVVDFFVPRFLPGLVQGGGNYSDLINKGSVGESASACPGQDQRGSKRDQAGRCDIGAVEFQYVSGFVNAGDFLRSLRFQQTFTVDLMEDSDEELFLPADPSICPVVMPRAALSGAAAACPWLSQAPAKGTVRLTADRKGYVYEASSNYHGFDVFQIEVTTTASRLNDFTHSTSRTRGVRATVSNEPSSGIKSSGTLDGGGFDWVMLAALMGLLSYRRIRVGGLQ